MLKTISLLAIVAFVPLATHAENQPTPVFAQVRFQTVTTTRDRSDIAHWVAVLTFRYVQRPASLADRFKNPLGFQITRYRRDQEMLPSQ